MLKHLFFTFQKAATLWKITGIVYLFTLALALTVGMQVFNVLEASFGQSLSVRQLLEHYDHTVISDFLKVHGASITPLLGQLRWLILFWFLFSVFLDAGMISTTNLTQAELDGFKILEAFWWSAARIFWQFLKIVAFFTLLAALWSALIFVPILTFLEPSIRWFPSEKYSVWLVLLLIGCWFLGMALLWLWSILSRFQTAEGVQGFWKSIRKGWATLRLNRRYVLIFFSVFLVLHMLILGVYLFVEALVGMTSPLLILLIFVLQQMTVFYRIRIRQFLYAGLEMIGDGDYDMEDEETESEEEA